MGNLLTPKYDAWSEDHSAQVELNRELISDIFANSKNPSPTVSDDVVLKTINQLKSGKAQDEYGLTAEHCKCGGDIVISCFPVGYREISVKIFFDLTLVRPVKIPIFMFLLPRLIAHASQPDRSMTLFTLHFSRLT